MPNPQRTTPDLPDRRLTASALVVAFALGIGSRADLGPLGTSRVGKRGAYCYTYRDPDHNKHQRWDGYGDRHQHAIPTTNCLAH